MVYTLNESGLRVLFKKYCKQGDKNLTLDDLERMVLKDSKLVLSRPQLVEAFGQCKQTIVKETEPKSFDSYHNLLFVEFLEFMSRIAVIFFRDSELAEEPL
mmetsp:Transcript_10005/g.13607  ORF Transcript_10005/g.13607 Transcript_10005/m.13607 type:complete len:101 (+) Transcript_10005:556-858(+)